jgi:pilus assembly protein TadC
VTVLAITAGCLVGFGVFILVTQLVATPPSLRAALGRLQTPATSLVGADQLPPSRLGSWLTQHLTRAGIRIPMPVKDLALLGQSPERLMTERLACLLLGLALPSLLTLLLTLVGFTIGWAFPAGVGLILGTVLGLAPDWAVREDAARRRRQFRHALTSYLDLVALGRAAGSAPAEALEAAAQVGHGWAFARIRGVLEAARRTGVPPWEGLARLGDTVGVGELTELADIAELAGNEGARVLDTLLAKAESMRAAALAETRAAANRSTTKMVMPLAVLGVGYMLLLGYPVLIPLFAG